MIFFIEYLIITFAQEIILLACTTLIIDVGPEQLDMGFSPTLCHGCQTLCDIGLYLFLCVGDPACLSRSQQHLDGAR